MAVEVRRIGDEYYAVLVEIWARAVLATHDFLSAADFDYFHRRIAAEYLPELTLYGAFAGPGDGPECLGFMGLAGGLAGGGAGGPLRVEMLFVDPARHRSGIGRALLDQAKALSGEVLLDVNEQNGGALKFYLAQGFEVTGRSALDPGGKPYPLLHLRFAGD